MNRKLIAKELLLMAKQLVADNLKVKFLENQGGKKWYSIGEDWQVAVGSFSNTYFKKDPKQKGKYNFEDDVFEEVPFNKVPQNIKNVKIAKTVKAEDLTEKEKQHFLDIIFTNARILQNAANAYENALSGMEDSLKNAKEFNLLDSKEIPGRIKTIENIQRKRFDERLKKLFDLAKELKG